MNDEPTSIDETPPGPFKSRIDALQVRVNKAALALHERNVRPTVQRIRTALGGGSPNDLAPALKRWRDEVLPTLKTAEDTPVGVPPLIADIVRELWTRALAAAAVDAVGGVKARRAIAQTEEVAALKAEIVRLRDQLEREQRLIGELRAERGRSEAIAKGAIARLDDAEGRERRLQILIGSLTARATSARPRGAVAQTGLRRQLRSKVRQVGRPVGDTARRMSSKKRTLPKKPSRAQKRVRVSGPKAFTKSKGFSYRAARLPKRKSSRRSNREAL